MKIPARLQIFPHPVILTEKDAARLSSHLESWPKLNKMFLLGIFNEPDLRRLAILELLEGRRWRILSRILGRLGAIERRQLAAKAKKLCTK